MFSALTCFSTSWYWVCNIWNTFSESVPPSQSLCVPWKDTNEKIRIMDMYLYSLYTQMKKWEAGGLTNNFERICSACDYPDELQCSYELTDVSATQLANRQLHSETHNYNKNIATFDYLRIIISRQRPHTSTISLTLHRFTSYQLQRCCFNLNQLENAVC